MIVQGRSEAIRIVHRCIQIAFQIWRLFLAARLLQICLAKSAKAEESSVGWLLRTRVCKTSSKQKHIKQNTERYLVAQKNFSVKERAERGWKYWCKRSRLVNRQFSASSYKERQRTIRTHIAQVFCFKLWSLFKTIPQPLWKERSSERLKKRWSKSKRNKKKEVKGNKPNAAHMLTDEEADIPRWPINAIAFLYIFSFFQLFFFCFYFQFFLFFFICETVSFEVEKKPCNGPAT